MPTSTTFVLAVPGVFTDPAELPVFMDPEFTQFEGCHQFQQRMLASTTLVLLVPGVFTNLAELPVTMDPGSEM